MKEMAVKKKGNLATRARELIGPFSLFLASQERDAEGNLLMEDYEDPLTGEQDRRAKRESESFTDDIWFYKNGVTPSVEEGIIAIKAEIAGEDRPQKSVMFQLTHLVAKWDLNVDGVPIPITIEGMTNAKVITEDGQEKSVFDSNLLYAILGLWYESTRPPKRLPKR